MDNNSQMAHITKWPILKKMDICKCIFTPMHPNLATFMQKSINLHKCTQIYKKLPKFKSINPNVPQCSPFYLN